MIHRHAFLPDRHQRYVIDLADVNRQTMNQQALARNTPVMAASRAEADAMLP